MRQPRGYQILQQKQLRQGSLRVDSNSRLTRLTPAAHIRLGKVPFIGLTNSSEGTVTVCVSACYSTGKFTYIPKRVPGLGGTVYFRAVQTRSVHTQSTPVIISQRPTYLIITEGKERQGREGEAGE